MFLYHKYPLGELGKQSKDKHIRMFYFYKNENAIDA